jgi:DNA repair ATPase RecN
MDDVYREMHHFRAALLDFNTHLGEALNDLETQHTEIDLQGDARKRYDEEWTQLHEIARQYLNQDSITYVEFLNSKLNALDRYLHGG